MSKRKLNIHYRGTPWGSRTQQHAYCPRYAHSQHIESHPGKKQPQAKIPIAFLFSQLHFNKVTSHALFYGGHLVMRSKRCAVQNQGIILRKIRQYSQSNNGGFVFLPHSPVVSHAMSNLDLSTMEDWLTAFMVWILALLVLLLCFGIFSLVRKNSFLSEKLVIGSITYKALQKNPDL